MNRAISAPTLHRAQTIGVAAKVPAEIRISPWASRAAMQAPAFGSSSTIAIKRGSIEGDHCA